VVHRTNHKPVTDLLAKLGLNRLDINVYIFLAKKGPRKGTELCNEMKILKQQLYTSLQNLKRTGIINATQNHPATFSAKPFEEILNLSIKSIIDEAQNTQHNKTELFKTWKSIASTDFKE
jgi:sugar-specific transcriptional regulator TrmB